jgi:hypothetical protein
MRYDNILTSSAAILTERGHDYGAPEKCFGRAAALASVFFERQVTAFEIAMVMKFEEVKSVLMWEVLPSYSKSLATCKGEEELKTTS